MKTKHLTNMQPIEHYFRDDCHPKNFLLLMHRAIMNYIRCASSCGGFVDMQTVCEDVEFLDSVYNMVHKAAHIPKEECPDTPTLESEG